MNVKKFRREIEIAADSAYAGMANEALSDSNEVFLSDIEFDEKDESALEELINSGKPVTGRILWSGDFTSPFEAHLEDGSIVPRFGPWEGVA